MMTPAKHPVIALLTDFGSSDHYVGTMKGAILAVEPAAVLVDISHEVPAHDIWAAGFLLHCAHAHFPSRTIYVCVVDPGVGTERRPIIVTTEQYFFVAPDNGLLSWIFEREEQCRVFEITADHYFRKPVSRTFHGRDIFAPVAGWLAHGIEPPQFGPAISNPVRLDIPKVQRLSDREFLGNILMVDRFGNLISNFPAQDMEKVASRSNRAFRFAVGDHTVTEYASSYGEALPERLIALSGSSGYVEFSLREASAAAETGARRGDPVRLIFG